LRTCLKKTHAPSVVKGICGEEGKKERSFEVEPPGAPRGTARREIKRKKEKGSPRIQG